MKTSIAIATAALAAALAACPSTHAQRPGARYAFSCNAAVPINLTLVSFNFNLQQTLNIGGQSSGAGAGKVTFNPLTVKFRADGASANQFVQDVMQGKHYTDCTLTETLSQPAGSQDGWNRVRNAGAGNTLQWMFHLVAPSGVTVIGSDASNTDSGGTDTPTGFIQVDLEYGAVQLQ